MSDVNRASATSGASSFGRRRTPSTAPTTATTRIAIPTTGCLPRFSWFVNVAGNSPSRLRMYARLLPLSGSNAVGNNNWKTTIDATNDAYGVSNARQDLRARSRIPAHTSATVDVSGQERHGLERGDDEHQHHRLTANVERETHQHAENDELIAAHFDHVTVALDAVAPPDDDGDRDEEQVLTEQLVGVQQIGRRRGDHGDDPERRPASEAAAHDAEQQCQPGTEQGDRHQLEPVVVEAPQVDERRQHQRPAPRVADRAEPGSELRTANRLSAMTWPGLPSKMLRA